MSGCRSRTSRRETRGCGTRGDVEGVVHFLLSPPSIAVVPVADLIAVQIRQFWGEYRVEVGFGVAADGGVIRVDGDVSEVV